MPVKIVVGDYGDPASELGRQLTEAEKQRPKKPPFPWNLFVPRPVFGEGGANPFDEPRSVEDYARFLIGAFSRLMNPAEDYARNFPRLVDDIKRGPSAVGNPLDLMRDIMRYLVRARSQEGS